MRFQQQDFWAARWSSNMSPAVIVRQGFAWCRMRMDRGGFVILCSGWVFSKHCDKKWFSYSIHIRHHAKARRGIYICMHRIKYMVAVHNICMLSAHNQTKYMFCTCA